MVGLYALMVRSGMSVTRAIVLFGVFVAGTMAARARGAIAINQSRFDSLHLIGAETQGGHAAMARRRAPSS
jgi:hypothetical protein